MKTPDAGVLVSHCKPVFIGFVELCWQPCRWALLHAWVCCCSVWHVEARCANADANIPPYLSALRRGKYPLLGNADETPSPREAEARTFKGPTPPTLRHLSPSCSAQCDITNNASYPPPRPGCPCVCLKYCPHNVHKAPETNQGPPLVCQTHSCVDNALIIDYTLLSASPRTASITPPVDPPSPRSPSVFTVHGLQGFFYSFPLPRAGAQDFGDSEGNKSISLGSDSLCTWAERSQLGQRLVSLTKQPELSDGGGGLAKGMAKRANVGRLGWCSQGSAGRHRRAKTGRNITSMFQIRRATQQRLGGNRKGD